MLMRGVRGKIMVAAMAIMTQEDAKEEEGVIVEGLEVVVTATVDLVEIREEEGDMVVEEPVIVFLLEVIMSMEVLQEQITAQTLVVQTIVETTVALMATMNQVEVKAEEEVRVMGLEAMVIATGNLVDVREEEGVKIELQEEGDRVEATDMETVTVFLLEVTMSMEVLLEQITTQTLEVQTLVETTAIGIVGTTILGVF